MAAARGPPVGVIAEGEQRRDVPVGAQPHVAAVAAVATVGPAPGNVGLAAERNRAGAAVAPTNVGSSFVDEPGHAPKDRAGGPGAGAPAPSPPGAIRKRLRTLVPH
jgi:hypothetical protein